METTQIVKDVTTLLVVLAGMLLGSAGIVYLFATASLTAGGI